MASYNRVNYKKRRIQELNQEQLRVEEVHLEESVVIQEKK